MTEGSITRWIGALKAGNPAAAQPLWEAYFRRLVGLARERLQGASRRMADEEDVALSTFDSVCAGAARGRFPQLSDRQNLWPLLVAITRNKCADLVRLETRVKRGGNASMEAIDPDELFAREPSPEFAAQVADELNHRLAELDAAGDPDLRAITLAKLDGASTSEIAAQLGCTRRTVERKLTLIARTWAEGDYA